MSIKKTSIFTAVTAISVIGLSKQINAQTSDLVTQNINTDSFNSTPVSKGADHPFTSGCGCDCCREKQPLEIVDIAS